jgi:hypothetical protein
MPNCSESLGSGKAKRCAVCDGKFGLVRHYSWRTPLCSKKCRRLPTARKLHMMMRPKRSLDRLLALNASGDLMGSFTRTPGARPSRPSGVGDAEQIEGCPGNIKCQRNAGAACMRNRAGA